MTLLLLWEEYQAEHPDGYGYTASALYGAWRRTISATMRQAHVAGELFVDFAGDTVPVFDALSGEVRQAHIFVAVLGASNTFAGRAGARGSPTGSARTPAPSAFSKACRRWSSATT